MIIITIKSFITGRVSTFTLTIKKALDLGYPGKLFPGSIALRYRAELISVPFTQHML